MAKTVEIKYQVGMVTAAVLRKSTENNLGGLSLRSTKPTISCWKQEAQVLLVASGSMEVKIKREIAEMP